jgi:6-pyruvoyltetrahydropterin/6-carboxytetrahydropterin synthase
MFEIEIKRNFSAAHSLKNYPGNCSRLHGHNWFVSVCVKSEKLNELGIAVDFRKLREELDAILLSLDHCNLNELPAFAERNPSSENIAAYVFKKMSEKINTASVRVSKVSAAESADSIASYYE